MKISRTMTPQGMRSLLDFRYRGVRYRPVLGYNLSADQEHEANVPIITRAARNIGPVEDALGAYAYAVDDGRQVVHLRHEGAARLAIMMLEGVVTP